MSLNYIVSAKKATVVTHAVVGNFTGDNDLNLILAKINRIQIYKVTSEGLKSVKEVPIFGRITNINLFKAKEEPRDSLFILTAKFHASVIGWDSATDLPVTRAAGSVADRVGRVSDHGTLVAIQKGVIAMRIYDSMLKVMRWEDGKELKCFNVRFDDPMVIDMTFCASLSTDDEMRMSYISQDNHGRHLKTIDLVIGDKEMKNISKQDNIENEARMILPVPAPYGGVIVVGQDTIVYNRSDNTYVSISPSLMSQNQSTFYCATPIDKNGQRFLLGDSVGRLFMLLLGVEDGMDGSHQVKDMKLELLGETSIAECLVYLDNAVIFVGSRFGDSQLIKLNTEPVGDNLFVSVLETFVNLAPIRDMTVVEADGQSQLVTCSGAFKDGSLRIIRNGIGIEEAASVDLPGVKGMFPLAHGDGSPLDTHLVVSFADDTHILKLNGEELEDTQLLDLSTNETTLWAGCISSSQRILQVTRKGMKQCCADRPSSNWTPPNGTQIDHVAVNGLTGQVVVTSGSNVYYVVCGDMSFDVVAAIQLDNEVSCVDISPFDDSKESKMVALGLWNDNSAMLLALPNLNTLVRQQLGVSVLPRSVLLVKMEDIVYLLVALGDGTLFYYTIDMKTGALDERKQASLGTQPLSLYRFESHGQAHVFACSDRPAVIYSSNQKLVFSNVNLKVLTRICCLNSANYTNSLVMSDGETLSIGTVDDIQKLHIRTVHLGESAKRVVHQKETGTLGVLVYRDENLERASISRIAQASSSSRPDSGMRAQGPPDSADSDVHSLVILDHITYEPLHAHEFAPNEEATSILSTRLGEDPNVYYIIGTAMTYNDETEPKSGRLIIFEAGTGEQRNRLRKVSEKEIRGAPYAMVALGGKLLVTVNSSVRLFEWSESDKPELRLECSHFNHIAALYVKVKGDQILVGDLMRGMTMLSYKTMECAFEEVAREYRSMWMTAVEFIDAETVLGAESSLNLVTGEVDRTSLDDKRKLKEGGQFYLGELVNVFRSGCLVTGHVDSQLPVDKPILFGTADGTIGLVVQLSEEHHAFLTEVEHKMAKSTHNCMRIDHGVYRQFQSIKHIDSAVGFVDGDLVETALDWPRDKLEQVFGNLTIPGATNSTTDDIMKLIEDLSRIH